MVHRWQQLGSIMVERRVISKSDLGAAIAEQAQSKKRIGEVLIGLGKITEAQLDECLAVQSGFNPIDLDEVEIAPEVLELVPRDTAEFHSVMPVAMQGENVVLATNGQNPMIEDDLRTFAGLDKVVLVYAPESAIERAQNEHYPGDDDIADLLQTVEGTVATDEGDVHDVEQLKTAAGDNTVVSLVNKVLVRAVKERATDIHVLPTSETTQISIRVDGDMVQLHPARQDLCPSLISRVMVMAKMDIGERRLPQDGSIKCNIQGRRVELRVATIPTAWGLAATLRVLDKERVGLDLEVLGFKGEGLETVQQVSRLPHGIILVTGPTGSGKTTTLYSLLRELVDPRTNIITVEDPVEYEVPGISQVPVNPKRKLTFPAALRSILRQDPDTVLIGEIRNKETATIAVQAALTGHLVFSTLHTNDAASSVTRMTDLGVEPEMVASVLRCVVAQRLLRKVCPACAETYAPEREEVEVLWGQAIDLGSATFTRGRGCDECYGSGLKGQIGLFEILRTTPALKSAIIRGAPTAELQEIALADGNMSTLRQAGCQLVMEGVTSAKEVIRTTVIS